MGANLITAFLAIITTLQLSAASPAAAKLDRLDPNDEWYSRLHLGDVQDQSVGFPGSAPLSPDQDNVARNLVILAEDLAEATTKQCHSVGIPIDYSSLKDELVECLGINVALIRGKMAQMLTSFHLRQGMVEQELDMVLSAVLRQKPLTASQKRTLTNQILKPVCSTLLQASETCTKPEYTTLAQAEQCKPDFEKDGEEMSLTFIRDLCKNDAAWVFDYLDATPLSCTEDWVVALESPKWEQCEQFFEPYKADKNRPGKSQRLESHEEMCTFTGKFGTCFHDLVVTSCMQTNPRQGQILMDTFKPTRSFWTAKCTQTNENAVGLQSGGSAASSTPAAALASAVGILVLKYLA